MKTVYIYLRQSQEDSRDALFLHAANSYAKSQGIVSPTFETSCTVAGKPFFTKLPAVEFSITHTKKLWACAFYSFPVGLDIQARQKYNPGIVNRFFHADEREYIACAATPADAFFTVWTAKESYVKYTGTGITDGFADFSVVADGQLKKAIGPVSLHVVTSLPPGYFGTLVADAAYYTLQYL